MDLGASSTRLTLHVGIEEFDVVGRNRVYVQLFTLDTLGNRSPLGKTDTQKGEHRSVSFESTVDVDFVFERKQRVIADVHIDQGSGEMDQLVGSATVEVVTLSLKSGAVRIPMTTSGVLVLRAAETCVGGGDLLMLKMEGKELAKRNLFADGSNTYVRLARYFPDDGRYHTVWKSKVQIGKLDPRWEETPPIKLANFIGSNPDESTIVIEVFQCNALKEDTSMGRVHLSVNELREVTHQVSTTVFPLRKDEKAHKDYGQLHITHASIQTMPSLTEFLRAGLQVELALSIDFSSSNGDPRHDTSLHHLAEDAEKPNAYQRTLTAVADVLLPYDSDNLVPVSGFSAVLPGDYVVSDYFNLVGGESEKVQGLDGIMDAYKKAVGTVRFAGPSRFAPVLKKLISASRSAPEGSYTVAVIITDGQIHDMEDTVDAIVNADDAPLSVVIVGVGEEDFASMNALDSDGAMLMASNGRVSRRDLVQFVAMRDVEGLSFDALSAEVLQEVPSQFSTFARLANWTSPNREAAQGVLN